MANYFTDNELLQYYLLQNQTDALERIAAIKENQFGDAEDFSYAPVDAQDALDYYARVMETIGEVAANHIAPNAAAAEKNTPTLKKGRITLGAPEVANIEALKQAGVMGMTLPRKFGGLNLPTLPFLMASEMVSEADASLQNIWGLQSCAESILDFGSEEQKERYLPRVCKGETMSMDLTEPDAGSDLQSAILKASYDEKEQCWRLNGVKRFITNGDADIHLVLARSEEGSKDGRGLSMFIYDKQNGGMTVRRIERKMGIKGSPTCEIVFRNAKAELCGTRRMGLIKYVMTLMNSARLGIAAQSVGISQAALKQARMYASERKQFGKNIIEFAAVREMIENIECKLYASRALLYKTALYVDTYRALQHKSLTTPLTAEEQAEMKLAQRMADSLTPMAKGLSSEYANQNAYDCVQVHGGSGYMNDYACERLYREARVTNIYEGTTQMQVVAAIKHATSGHYGQLIDNLDQQPIDNPNLLALRSRLRMMTLSYKGAVERVVAAANSEWLDLAARRIVEMAAEIIMGYLLLSDANKRADLFEQTTRNYIAMAESNVAQHSHYIRQHTPTPKSQTQGTLSRTEIEEQLLPHRDAMMLVDNITVEGDEAVAHYKVRGDETFLQGHFPDWPVVPGVILCEIMGQGSSLLVAEQLKGRTPMYTGFEQVKFRRPVKVGDEVCVRGKIVGNRGLYFTVDTTAYVGEKVVCSGRLSFMLIDNDKLPE